MTTEAQAAWTALAAAECDHHPECARRAIAELVRLGEIVPAQRSPDAVEQ